MLESAFFTFDFAGCCRHLRDRALSTTALAIACNPTLHPASGYTKSERARERERE